MGSNSDQYGRLLEDLQKRGFAKFPQGNNLRSAPDVAQAHSSAVGSLNLNWQFFNSIGKF